MITRLRLFAVAVLAASAVLAAQAPSASAWDCTPGYWKNHVDTWPGLVTSASGAQLNLSPDTKVGDLFAGANVTKDKTLLEALQGGGGTGSAGAEKILMRAAVARLLNAGFDNEKLALDRIRTNTSDAISSGDRDAMTTLGTFYDNINNGVCGLS
jgi:hypothetical protein